MCIAVLEGILSGIAREENDKSKNETSPITLSLPKSEPMGRGFVVVLWSDLGSFSPGPTGTHPRTHHAKLVSPVPSRFGTPYKLVSSAGTIVPKKQLKIQPHGSKISLCLLLLTHALKYPQRRRKRTQQATSNNNDEGRKEGTALKSEGERTKTIAHTLFLSLEE